MLVVALIAALVLRSGGSKGKGEVFLEPTSSSGPDPFTASVAAAAPSSTAAPSTTTTSAGTKKTTTTAKASQALVVQTQSGTTPGLYGGTRDESSCDQEKMVAFLASNPSKAAAWAKVEGISTSQLPGYIRSLTPVHLRSDTRVTNHGFANGSSTSRQSVLQAGTAVLVDARGVPRARCACGNPLLAPVAVKTTPSYTGTPWTGFTPNRVTAVTPAPAPATSLVLVDDTTGTAFARPVGTSGGSDTTVTTSTTTTTTVPGATTTTKATSSTTTQPAVQLPPGVVVQLTADTGVTTDANGAVTAWAGAGGLVARPTSAGSAPVLEPTGLAGQPAVRFSGKQGLTMPVDVNPSTAPNLTVFTVFASATTTPARRALYSDDDGGFDRTTGLDDRTTTNFGVFTGSGVGPFFAIEANKPYLTTDAWTATSFTGRVNGAERTKLQVANGAGLKTLTLGQNPTYLESWDGPVAAFIVYTRTLSGDEIATVESYLLGRYGLK